MSPGGSRSSRASSLDSSVLTPSFSVLSMSDSSDGKETSDVGPGSPEDGRQGTRATDKARSQDPSSTRLSALLSNEGADRLTSQQDLLVDKEIRISPPSFAITDEPDPDDPLPSIEKDVSETGRRSDTTITALSSSLQTLKLRTASELPMLPLQNEQRVPREKVPTSISQLPSETRFQGNSSSPSLQITPAPPTASDCDGPLSLRDQSGDNIADKFDTLRLRSPSTTDTPSSSRTRKDHSLPPSRRRRSSPAVDKSPYRVQDEEPPATFSQMRELHHIFREAHNTTQRISTVLSGTVSSREPGSSMEKLHRESVRLIKFELPSSRIVGLVGDSGVGKSSLINSLLDEENLARSNNNGSACTCVATEYHYHERNDYVVEAEIFSMEELEKQYQEMLAVYQASQFQSASDKSEETTELQRSAKIAKSTFEASFGLLLKQRPDVLDLSIQKAVSTMVQWASQLMPQRSTSEGNRLRETYNDVEACSSRIRELTSEVSNVDSQRPKIPWPFVKRLRVYLGAYILSKGLILADLPGLRDVNAARQNITERYILQCHQIFAVTRIVRSITDQSVQDVFQLARRAKLSNVHVVCTMSDDIEAREALDTYPAEKRNIESMERKIRRAKEDEENLEELIEELEEDSYSRSEGEDDEYVRLLSERRRAQKIQNEERFRLHRHLIDVRNRDISCTIQKQCQKQAASDDLKVFCVSNRLYWMNRRKSAVLSKPYIELSGIVDLRRYSIGIVAESHKRAVDHYICHEIPAFLGSIRLWVEAGSGDSSAQKKQAIINTTNLIHAKVNELSSSLEEISYHMRKEFRRQVQQRMEQFLPQWSISANRAASVWLTFHHASYAAFCRKHGEHQTPSQPYRCWNEEAIAAMVASMSTIWNTLIADLEGYLDDLAASLESTLRDAVRLASSMPKARNRHNIASHALATTLRHRTDTLLYDVENAVEEFRDKMSSLRTNAWAPLRTAFIGQLMEDTYLAANMESGSGSDQRRKRLITSRYGSQELFNSHKSKLKDTFRKASVDLEATIRSIVNRRITLIEADLQLLRDDNVILESERNPEFRLKLEKEVERANQEVEQMSAKLRNG